MKRPGKPCGLYGKIQNELWRGLASESRRVQFSANEKFKIYVKSRMNLTRLELEGKVKKV